MIIFRIQNYLNGNDENPPDDYQLFDDRCKYSHLEYLFLRPLEKKWFIEYSPVTLKHGHDVHRNAFKEDQEAYFEDQRSIQKNKRPALY